MQLQSIGLEGASGLLEKDDRVKLATVTWGDIDLEFIVMRLNMFLFNHADKIKIYINLKKNKIVSFPSSLRLC